MAGCGCGTPKKRKGNLGASSVEHVERARFHFQQAIDAAKEAQNRTLPCSTRTEESESAAASYWRGNGHLESIAPRDLKSPEGRNVRGLAIVADRHLTKARKATATCETRALSGTRSRSRKRKR